MKKTLFSLVIVAVFLLSACGGKPAATSAGGTGNGELTKYSIP